MAEKFTIRDFNERYPDDDACLAEIFNNRYGELKNCYQCKKETKFHRVTARKCYACQFCGYQLHPLADTIFHKSETSLKMWFFAIYLFANSKNGVSGKELQRQLGVTYKTAWRMAKQIRLLFTPKGGNKLSNTVEVDETYVGRRARSHDLKKGNKGMGRGAKGKIAVFGLVERGGEVRAHIVPDVTSKTLFSSMADNVNADSTIVSDTFAAYRRVKSIGFHHKQINHSLGEYVNGDIHTNTIEGFWSQLKRSINGTYHAVSPKYLQHYVDEFAYRYNLRHASSASVFPSMLSEVLRQVQ